MSKIQKQAVAKAVAALAEIAEEFEDELGRRPASGELLEIILWGLRSGRDDLLSDATPYDVQEITSRLRKGAQPKPSWPKVGKTASVLDELNDSVFVAASAMVADLSQLERHHSGKPLSSAALSALLVQALHASPDELLADVHPADIEAVRIKTRRTRSASAVPGDVVAIPSDKGDYLMAVVVAKDDIGTAYGFFEGRHALRPVSALRDAPVRRHPVYSSQRLIASGAWKIVGHDDNLLARFPAEPEIFYRGLSVDGTTDYGPYGSGETAAGRLRRLTKSEAEEIGLLSGVYRQLCPAEYIERYLEGRLP